MVTKKKKIVWKETAYPQFHGEISPIFLTDETMLERKEKVLSLMKKKQLDCLIVYCDLEHGSNFEYLTGFLTRFEEALLALHQDGKAYLLLGNENTKMIQHTRIPAECIHVPLFSLPNQPMQNDGALTSYLEKAEITKDMTVGIAGWKLFSSQTEENASIFDVPYFIVEAIIKAAGKAVNATGIFIDPAYGARIVNNANEIAHYEFGASLASDCVLQAMDALEIGKTEMEIGTRMNSGAQPTNVITICATGDRFYKANLYPTDKKIRIGDKLSLTVGYKGGLTSRAGYAAETIDQLPKGQQDYLEVIAVPYFEAVASWLENIRVGMPGGELYRLVEAVLPKNQYHWSLNPGHLTADEEWLSSPIYSGSKDRLQSGMLLQIDIIPSRQGYGGVGAESTVALADARLRAQIKKDYSVLWKIIEKRQEFIRKELGLQISDEVLPMSDTVAYWRPLMLNKRKVLSCIEK